ncbi:sortase domain-containing protein [Anaerobacillus alkalilacustris]|uniref:sortase domain-containing protein n=1 Tax=Anaerobacillus alkalilacustris TaxID=393763 RepID=UPI000A04A87E|nr:sortase [Anaerobacillus alkalilacustris]
MESGSYTYEVTTTYIVDADDLTVIDFTIDEEVLLLTTCYPFSYVGIAPLRYVIEAKPK